MADHIPLREQLRQMLEAERLDDAQYARLRTVATPPRRRTRLRWLTAAAAALAFLAIAWPMLRPAGDAWQVDQIARHVSHYHLQTPPLDVRSSSLADVRAGLDRLDFQPVLPEGAEGWRLLGARECTLLGGVATQLLFQTPDGRRVTVYETAYDPDRFARVPGLREHGAPIEVDHRGLTVRVWIESGVVMARVQDARAA